MTDCPAPQTSLLWPNPADLPSTTSAGSSPSWTTIPPSLDSQPLRLNHCSVSRTLQRLVCNPPRLSHVTRLLHDLHWLPVSAHIRFQMMVLDFKAVNRTEPVYLQTLVRPRGPERALHSSTSAGRLVPPSLRANKAAQRSRSSSLFWSLRGGTNSRPTSGQQSLCVCSRRLKTHLFRLHQDSLPTKLQVVPPSEAPPESQVSRA